MTKKKEEKNSPETKFYSFVPEVKYHVSITK